MVVPNIFVLLLFLPVAHEVEPKACTRHLWLLLFSPCVFSEHVEISGKNSHQTCLRFLPPVLHFSEPLNFTKGFLAHYDGLVPVLARWCYNSF